MPQFSPKVRRREHANQQFPGPDAAVSGRRYYNPSQGRFLGRDPIEEQGGLNLYGFCANNGINRWDYLGMDPWSSWFVKDNGDGTFTGTAQRLYATDLPDTVEGALVDMGSWNFSSEADARNWAQERARGIVDDRGNPTFTRYVRGWDQQEADNLTDSEYWSDYSWNRFYEWRDADGVRSTFENPGFPLQHPGFDRLAMMDAEASAIIDAYFAANPGANRSGILPAFFDLLVRIWALPNSAVGLVYGLTGMSVAATPVLGSDGVLRFTNMPGWLMPTAMSFGHVQVYGPGSYQNPNGSWALNRFGVPVIVEETLHTRQAEVLGPAYLPLHLLSLSGSFITGGGTHNNNLLERGPERGVGPWPWD